MHNVSGKSSANDGEHTENNKEYQKFNVISCQLLHGLPLYSYNFF